LLQEKAFLIQQPFHPSILESPQCQDDQKVTHLFEYINTLRNFQKLLRIFLISPVLPLLLCKLAKHQYDREGLLIFYRTNYSDKDFQTLYQKLPNKLYLITAGVIHQLLMIDNLYFLNSGLPTHFSNLQHLMSYLNSDIPATKNNWLLFYRELTKKSLETFPTPNLNSCQRAYIAYCLHRFVAQYTDLWSTPTPLDQINCCWQADLNNFSIHTEAALHSPFSEYDMRLNLPQVQEEEMV